MIPDPSLDSAGEGEDDDGVSISHLHNLMAQESVRGVHCLDLENQWILPHIPDLRPASPSLCTPVPQPSRYFHLYLVHLVSLRCQPHSTGCFVSWPQLWFLSAFITHSRQTILVINSYPPLPWVERSWWSLSKLPYFCHVATRSHPPPCSRDILWVWLTPRHIHKEDLTFPSNDPMQIRVTDDMKKTIAFLSGSLMLAPNLDFSACFGFC